jgi:hypothetical protein
VPTPAAAPTKIFSLPRPALTTASTYPLEAAEAAKQMPYFAVEFTAI